MFTLEIRYLGEAEVVFTCPINYNNFPFHVATCRLQMTSFNADNTSMKFRNDLEPWPPGQVRNCVLKLMIKIYFVKRFWMETRFEDTLSMLVISLAR